MAPTKAEVIEASERAQKLEHNFATAVEAANTLNTGFKDLALETGNLKNGTHLGAVQLVRDLNEQNGNFLNGVFRPGLIRQNCEAFSRLATEFTFVNKDGCITRWDALKFWRPPSRKPFVGEEAAKRDDAGANAPVLSASAVSPDPR